MHVNGSNQLYNGIAEETETVLPRRDVEGRAVESRIKVRVDYLKDKVVDAQPDHEPPEQQGVLPMR